jgi:uncharacterized protein YjbI with pentapeptide repeats
MANEEHLAILRQGVAAWNTWCREYRTVVPDPIKADLSRDLHGLADLAGADLRGVDLAGADLRGVDLAGADLRGAHLSRAALHGADLAWAALGGAAYLGGAYLGGAYLNGADLAEAMLHETVFADVDLSTCRGLESCVHVGPSIIDHRTLQRSGPLPLAFLRGVGLQETLIDYLPSLLNQPIQFYSCFISYSSKDQAFADRLHADLQAKGVRCWFAPHDMRTGDRIRTRIDEVIRIHQKLLLILSENAIASGWVEKEVETAFEREQEAKDTVLFPIRLDATVIEQTTGWAADIKRTRHITDFTRWKDHDAYSKGLERLLRDLKVEATTPPSLDYSPAFAARRAMAVTSAGGKPAPRPTSPRLVNNSG